MVVGGERLGNAPCAKSLRGHLPKESIRSIVVHLDARLHRCKGGGWVCAHFNLLPSGGSRHGSVVIDEFTGHDSHAIPFIGPLR